MAPRNLPIAVYYEHQEWFRPLFAELERRGTAYKPIDARRHRYDPGSNTVEYSLFFNRMSSSAYTRGNGQGIYHTANYLAHLERIGTPVVNGSRSFAIETSKALQLSLLASLSLAFPRTAVMDNPADVLEAGEELGFPLIIKPNIGGAGAGIVRYDSAEALRLAFEEEQIDFGFHQAALVQELVPMRGGHITRVETLGREYLYAIRVFTSGENFNLCPADACGAPAPAVTDAACPVEAVKRGFRVEACTPPQEVLEAVGRIVEAAEIDAGGIEYIVDDRDGRILFYDINALSNFVADAPSVVGFDPHARLVDYLERRAF
jgi:glutathione synthase/RimK-type ligase-like ATP-grasp enzyme